MTMFKFEYLTALQRFVVATEKNSHDLSDLIIAHSAREHSLFELA